MPCLFTHHLGSFWTLVNEETRSLQQLYMQESQAWAPVLPEIPEPAASSLQQGRRPHFLDTAGECS